MALEKDLSDLFLNNSNASEDDGVIIREMEDKLEKLISEQKAQSSEVEGIEKRIASIIRTICKEELNLEKIMSRRCEKEHQIQDECEAVF